MAHYINGQMYLCRIEDQLFGTTSKGTEFFALVIRPIATVEGEQRHTITGEFSRKVSLWLNSDSNVERSTERLQSLCPEWDGSWSSLDPKTEDGTSLKGVEVELRCSHSQSGDKVYDNFDFPRTFEADSYVSDSDVAKKLDRLYGTAKKKKPKPKAEAKAEVSAEEVPF
jgi:hypothetical protein